MHIGKIKLLDFRNYSFEEISFCNGINLITGDNGQGKTNIIEAIYLASFGKSFRTGKDAEMIRFNENRFKVHVDFETRHRNQSIEISFNSNKEKRISLNDVPVTKIQEIIGEMNIVLFSPEDMKLIKDSPSERRKFLDREISSISKQYYLKIVEFNRIIDQRNNLLKQISMGRSDISQMEVWNEKFSAVAAFIMHKRKKFLDELSSHAIGIHLEMTGGKDNLEIEYSSSCPYKENIDEQFDEIMKKLEKSIDSDIYRGHTSYGTHKDDINFKVNGKDLKSFGSQGQKRTAVLAIKISQTKLIKEIKGENPILLLDDVLSELDLSRQIDILNYTEGIQTIITSAELNEDIIRYFENKSIESDDFEYMKIYVKDAKIIS